MVLVGIKLWTWITILFYFNDNVDFFYLGSGLRTMDVGKNVVTLDGHVLNKSSGHAFCTTESTFDLSVGDSLVRFTYSSSRYFINVLIAKLPKVYGNCEFFEKRTYF